MGYGPDLTSAGVTVTTAKGLVKGRPFGRVSITEFGGVEGGVVDNTTAALNAMTALGTTGGIIEFGPGTWLITGQLALPDDGAATNPRQPSFRFTGAGASHSGRGTAPQGGTILDLRYSGTYGKIVTLGLGYLEIDHLTLADFGADSTPFIYTTYTTLHIHNCEFYGTKVSATADQDAIILGGTTEVEGPRGYDVGFQGYGTVIRENYFSRVRRAVYGRTFANAVVVRDNTVWSNSGSNLPGGAAIEFDNVAAGAVQYSAGNVITGNLIEVPNYAYGIKLGRAAMNTVAHNNMYDATGTTLAAVRLEASAQQNIVIDGYAPGTLASVSDAGRNTHIGINMNVRSTFQEPVSFTNTDYATEMRWGKVTGPSNPITGGVFTVQPDATLGVGNLLLLTKRSAAEVTNPGANTWAVKYDGAVLIDSTAVGGGNETGPYCQWTNGGRRWYGVGTLAGQENGSNMTIDSGPGGSYLDLNNYAVRFYDNNGGPQRAIVGGGADQVRLGSNATIANNVGLIAGTGTPEGIVTAPVGSIYMRRDGGAGTSMYVKESGVAATGWIAK